jgi:hypothetical protein
MSGHHKLSDNLAPGAMDVTVVTVAAAAEAAAECGGAAVVAVGAAVAVAGAYAAAFGSCAFSIRALSRPPSMAFMMVITWPQGD